MSSSPSRDGVFATFTFCSAGCTEERWAAPPALVVIVVLVLALAAHAGPDRAVPGTVAVLAAAIAELLAGRRSDCDRAE
jgi:hypothetical protein